MQQNNVPWTFPSSWLTGMLLVERLPEKFRYVADYMNQYYIFNCQHRKQNAPLLENQYDNIPVIFNYVRWIYSAAKNKVFTFHFEAYDHPFKAKLASIKIALDKTETKFEISNKDMVKLDCFPTDESLTQFGEWINKWVFETQKVSQFKDKLRTTTLAVPTPPTTTIISDEEVTMVDDEPQQDTATFNPPHHPNNNNKKNNAKKRVINTRVGDATTDEHPRKIKCTESERMERSGVGLQKSVSMVCEVGPGVPTGNGDRPDQAPQRRTPKAEI